MGKKLNNKIAVITGAAMGNGLGTAMVLAEQGATIILLDIDPQVVDVAKSLAQKGGKALGCVVDIREEHRIQQVAKEVINKYGKIDILVNNAGVCHMASFLETSKKIRDDTIGVNIKGTWNVTQAFLPYMIKASYGKIINISSVTGPIVGEKGMAAYSMSKAAILGLTKSLAMEVATHNITVNAVCPGYIRTPMTEYLAKESNSAQLQTTLDELAGVVPMKRLGTIEELANLVAFLGSDDSRYITGTQMVIDGGSTLQESFGVLGV